MVFKNSQVVRVTKASMQDKILREVVFKDITDLDLRRRMLDEKMQAMEDEILPFGFTNTIEEEGFVDDEGQSWFYVDKH